MSRAQQHNLTTRSGNDNVSLNMWGLLAICLSIMTFSFILGVVVIYCMRDNRAATGFLQVRRPESHQRQPGATSGTAPAELLGPDDDKFYQLGAVRVYIYCTRRRLLEAYNAPSATLTLEKSVESAWVPNSHAKSYLKGFKLDGISFTKRPGV